MSRIVQWSITVALAGFLFGFDTASFPAPTSRSRPCGG